MTDDADEGFEFLARYSEETPNPATRESPRHM